MPAVVSTDIDGTRDGMTMGKHLFGRLLDIATGESGLPLERVVAYREIFERQGFEVPPLTEEQIAQIRTGKAQGRFRSRSGMRFRGARAGERHWVTAFNPACRWLGALLTEEPATCGSARKIEVYKCQNVHKLCVLTERECRSLRDPDLRIQSCETCVLREMAPQFITTEQLARDTLALIAKLPPNITRVAGVARSGLHPATMIAMMLHIPMTVIRHHQGDCVDTGNGWRLNEGRPKAEDTVLVVDDTTMTGNSLNRTKGVIAEMPGKKLYAAVYVNPLALWKPDLWAVNLPWPHLLEWNLFNSVVIDACATDFDGVFCEDCSRDDDDDGPRYRRFLEQARPLHLARKRPVKLIVTARLEKYRAETMAWLDKWGMRVERLVMGPWSSKQERSRADVVAFKAEHLREWLEGRSLPGPRMFIESDPWQARRLADLTGGFVVCPAAGQCFSIGGRPQ